MTYRSALLAAVGLIGLCDAANAACTLPVLNATGGSVTLQGYAAGANCVVDSQPSVQGVEVSPSAPMPVILESGSNAVGSVSVSSSALPSGAATAANQTPPLAAGTSATIAEPVQGVAGGVPMPMSATALPLPTGAATAANQTPPLAAGTSATIAEPVQGVAGGVPMPMSAAALPLPTGAATAANQVHPTLFSAAVQQASGSPLTVTVGTYAANTVVAGPLQFPAALATSGGSASVNGAQFYLASTNATPTFFVLLFSQPLIGTYTNGAPFAINAADMPHYLGRLVSDPLWIPAGATAALGTTLDTMRDVTNTEASPTTTVYGLLVTGSATYAPTAATDLAANGVVLETLPH